MRSRSIILATAAVSLAVIAGILLVQGAKPPSIALASSTPGSGSGAAPSPSRGAVRPPMPPPALRTDGLATVASIGGLEVRSAPGVKAGTALKPPLPSTAIVFLTRGPKRVDGVDWWEIQADYRPRSSPLFGWVRATDAAGAPALTPFAAACPAAGGPVEARAIGAIGNLQALACFGRDEFTVKGLLQCYDAAVDGAVGGASWLDTHSSCAMDGDAGLRLEGPVISGLLDTQPGPVIGHYEVGGHFDDPEARACSWISFGMSAPLHPFAKPDPGAVIVCRQVFVVTAVTKLP